ncbi:hypothetical protein [Natrinema sp. DC36]|uniref:hypothetical protein n=1 Tax=Natrinema sp. DC36 TaxID=2878680 RepID=UPI001CF04377|nr:hypothetical protein [Natrinema sp. DC36]
MVDPDFRKLIERIGVREIVVLPVVSLVLYLATGDLYISIIGPVVVALVSLAFATVDIINGDRRYVKLGVFIFGIAGGAIMFVSASIPAWFGIMIALVSLWWTASTLVNISQHDWETVRDS